ncbi:MAG: LysR substrate-binding domain-containing protein [Gammaproteobacteria bacterium]|nr:LysR substrate-binding domain-containing protein [Gammaproteobacteria bacterium]
MLRATIRQMQIFESVARHLSFTRAAEELFITQSSVSLQVKQLSTSLDTVLIESVSNKLYLTQSGKKMLQHCQHILRELKDVENDMASFVDKPQGKISISGTITSQFFLPRVFGGFNKKYPEIELEMKVVTRPEIDERMSHNKDDLYIVSRKPTHMDVEIIPFVENPMIVIASMDHPLANEKNISLERLMEEKFLIREPGSSTLKEIEKFYKTHNIKLRPHMILGGNEAIKQGVIGGLGISILSLFTSVLEIKLNILKNLNVTGFPIQGQWYFAYPAEKKLPGVVNLFTDYVQTEGREIANKCLEL